jgi:hypothetical protein
MFSGRTKPIRKNISDIYAKGKTGWFFLCLFEDRGKTGRKSVCLFEDRGKTNLKSVCFFEDRGKINRKSVCLFEDRRKINLKSLCLFEDRGKTGWKNVSISRASENNKICEMNFLSVFFLEITVSLPYSRYIIDFRLPLCFKNNIYGL